MSAQVALDGLDNILKIGEADKENKGMGGQNDYAIYIEESGGMVAIHNLQHHDNLEIYKKCFFIMDKYFPEGEFGIADCAGCIADWKGL